MHPFIRILLLVCVVAAPAQMLGQSKFTINGRLKIDGGDLNGARVVVYRNGEKERVITNGLNKFSLDLDLNANYILSFERPGFVSKKLSFNTNVPAEAGVKGFTPFDYAVSLFKQYDDLNMVVFNQPVGLIRYEAAAGDFDYDTDYTKSIHAQLQQAIADVERKQKEEAQNASAEAKRKAAEEKAQAKAQAEAEKQEAKAQAEAEKQAAAQARAKAEAEAREQAEAQARAKAEAEKHAEAQAKAKAEAEEKERAQAAAMAKAEAEALAEKAKAEQRAQEEDRAKEEKLRAEEASRAKSEEKPKPKPEPVEKAAPKPVMVKNAPPVEQPRATTIVRNVPAPVRTTPVSRPSQDAVRASVVTGSESRRSISPVTGSEERPPIQTTEIFVDRNEELIVEPNKVMTIVQLTQGEVVHEYRKVIHKWGGTFYFKNGSACSQLVYEQEALGEQLAGASPRSKMD